MKKITLLVGILMLGVFLSCTENVRVKKYGGTGEILLEKGEKLEMVTWKESQLWVLTSSRPDSIQPKTYNFSEKSSFGLIEGNYIIKEK